MVKSFADITTTQVSTANENTQNITDKDVKSMEAALTGSLLSLSNNLDTQAKAAQKIVRHYVIFRMAFSIGQAF